MIVKTQKLIRPEDCASRQHAIPFDVYKYAKMLQVDVAGNSDGENSTPSLPDIYAALAIAGMELLKNQLEGSVEFTEIGNPSGRKLSRVKFDTEFDAKLRALKAQCDEGVYNVTALPDARQVKKISLISLAVNLMRLAIKEKSVHN